MSKPWYVCSCSWCRSQRTSTKSCRTCVNTSTPASPTSPVSWCLTRASKWPPTHTLMEELQVHVLWRFHSVLRSSTSTSVCLPVDAFHKDFHTLSLFFSSETGTRHRVHQFQPSWISFLCFFSVIPLTNKGGKYVTTQPVQGWALMNCAGAGGALELCEKQRPRGTSCLPLWTTYISHLLPGLAPETEYDRAKTVWISARTGVTHQLFSSPSPSRDWWRFLEQPEDSGAVAAQSWQHRREGDQRQQNHLQRPGGVLQGQSKGPPC